MSNESTFQGILGKLDRKGDSVETGKPLPERPSSSKRDTADAVELSHFENRLGAILNRRSKDLDDNVFVIGLDKCKAKLGPRWDKLQDQVHQTVRNILERKLGPQDVFMRRDDQSYLVVFTASSARQAQLRCLAIGEEIVQRLTGREGGSDLLDVKSALADTNGHLQLRDLPKISAIFEQVPGDLEAAASKAEAVAPEMFRDDKEPGLKDIRFVYRPMLAVRTKIISTFMCLPIRQVHSNVFLSGYDVLEPGSVANQYLTLDTLTARMVARDLDQLANTGGKSLLAVPVHYETLADPRRRTDYARFCSSVFANHRDRIVFEMVGLPAGIPQVRLTELVSLLRPFGRAIIARFRPEHREFPAFRIAGLHAVGVDLYNDRSREEALLRELDDFAQIANKNSLKTYALGVRSISLYTAIVAAGFDYAAGHALTSAAETPENAYVYRMESPYLSLLDAGKGDGPEEPSFDDDVLQLDQNER